MYTGTRKKIVDFKKMLHNDLDMEKAEPNKNSKLSKKEKENDLLGKKRKDKLNEKEKKKKKIKIKTFPGKITKDEYIAILSNYSEELKSLNISLNENNVNNDNEDRNNNNNNEKKPKHLTTDLSTLYYNLFLSTKFENSKPYKMIDYIIGNDDSILNLKNDRDKFEDMKKSILSRPKIDISLYDNILNKEIYEYYKTVFSKSVVSKLCEKVDKNIMSKYSIFSNDKKEKESNLSNNEKDKKDKFTYSSFITERMKQCNNQKSYYSYAHDIDYFKCLIYLNNKYNGYLNKKEKIDKNCLLSLEKNLELINCLTNNKSIEDIDIEKKYMKDLLNNKKLQRFMRKKFKNVLCCFNQISNIKVNKDLYFSLMDSLTKNKDDDADKIKKHINSIINQNLEINQIESLIISIRLLYFLYSLNNHNDNGNVMNNNKFWRDIITYSKSHPVKYIIKNNKQKKDFILVPPKKKDEKKEENKKNNNKEDLNHKKNNHDNNNNITSENKGKKRGRRPLKSKIEEKEKEKENNNNINILFNNNEDNNNTNNLNNHLSNNINNINNYDLNINNNSNDNTIIKDNKSEKINKKNFNTNIRILYNLNNNDKDIIIEKKVEKENKLKLKIPNSSFNKKEEIKIQGMIKINPIQEIKNTIINKFESGEDIFRIIREKKKKEKKHKEKKKKNEKNEKTKKEKKKNKEKVEEEDEEEKLFNDFEINNFENNNNTNNFNNNIINIENKEDNNNIEEDSDKTEDDPKNMELD